MTEPTVLEWGEGDGLARALLTLADLQRQLVREERSRVETQALFDLVLNALPEAVVLTDVRGRVSNVNEAAVRLAGRGAADLVGTALSAVFAGEVPQTPWHLFDRSPASPFVTDADLISLNSDLVPVSVSCSLLRDTGGRVFGALYAARDLRQTHRLVRQLEQAEARWRLIAELGDLLGRQLDPRESLEETCRWLGRSTSAGVAVILTRDLLVERVEAWPSAGPLAAQLTGLVRRPLHERSALYIAIHSSRTVHATTLQPDFPLLDGTGVPPGVGSAVVVPLTARNLSLGALVVYAAAAEGVRQRALVEQAAARVALALANSQLREAVSWFEAAQESARFREDLMAGVSHDMQTPLAVLLGSIRALQSGGDLSAEVRDKLYERMARRGVQLRHLVQQFLDFSRLGAGKPIVVRPVRTDVGELLRRIRADLAGRRPVTLEIPPGLPSAFADPVRLDQVLTNLVSNALKFSAPGSPLHLGARARRDAMEITVTDRGQGISPGDLDLIFEKFHRGSTASNIPGTGLGLYVSRAIMEAQGGELLVASRLGQGSRFSVVLPLKPNRA
ncbi:MAG TPA: ATP-binding protein [Acidimicrobiales bacterium]|nr:ATP-binding protein [Acidimicrobiales bacterium]